MTALADSLTQMSARRVARDLELLREEKRQIEAQEALLEQILKIKQAHARNGSGPAKAARPNSRDAIRALLASDPKRTWSPTELRKALATKGVEMTTKALSVALHRMVGTGELIRAGHGAYSLPQRITGHQTWGGSQSTSPLQAGHRRTYV